MDIYIEHEGTLHKFPQPFWEMQQVLKRVALVICGLILAHVLHALAGVWL